MNFLLVWKAFDLHLYAVFIMNVAVGCSILTTCLLVLAVFRCMAVHLFGLEQRGELDGVLAK
jgi:hypothetical protein